MENTYESRYPEIPYECRDGWTRLIDNCLDKMFAVDPDITIDQVKEKFGGLRIYYTSFSDSYNLLDDFVSDAEDEADVTCEVCGSKSSVRLDVSYGWYSTVCRVCKP